MSDVSYTHGGGIVVRFEGKDRTYLLVRSSTDPTHWVFPKGHIKPGESPEKAALREVREEAGVKAMIISTLRESEFMKENENVRVLYFVMRYQGSTQAEENRDVKWCAYKEAVDTLSFDDSRELLAQAHSALK